MSRTPTMRMTNHRLRRPPWEFDFLCWQNGCLISIAHHPGAVPSLVLYPAGTKYLVSDGDAFGLVQRKSSGGRSATLLVETLDGRQSYISVTESRR